MTKEEFIKAITTFPFLTEEELDEANLIDKTSKEDKEAINDVFEYYKINDDCIALFGDWSISAKQDIVNISTRCNRYPLLSGVYDLHKEDKIFEQLRGKEWFDTKQQRDLSNALDFIKFKFK